MQFHRFGYQALVALTTFNLVVGASILSANPANAEVSEIAGFDEHLHLVQSQEQVTVMSGGWNRYGGGVGGFQGNVYHTYVTKGQIPISDDRFIELVDRTHSDDDFVDHINQIKADRSLWGWSTLGLFALSPFAGLGAGNLGYHLAAAQGVSGSDLDNSAFVPGILTFAGVYLVATVAMGVWMAKARNQDMSPKRLFSDEEAYEAIQAYNRALDARLSQPNQP